MARREGTKRALVGGTIAVVLFYWKPTIGLVAGGLSLLVFVLALTSPLVHYARFVRRLEQFGQAVGLGVTRVLMCLVFFLFLLPLGLVLRLRGKLCIRRGANPDLPTYWMPVDRSGTTPKDYRRQF